MESCVLHLKSRFNVFSSPDLKAQESFSDWPLSVVCLSVFALDFYIFDFSLDQFNFFSPEAAAQFQLNLEQILYGYEEFKIVHIKDEVLVKGEVITKLKILRITGTVNSDLQESFST
jgi:hypothetical protein